MIDLRLEGDAIHDFAVIGAGVIGVTTAYALARRGVSVALVDQESGAGLGTSFANGGQLSYAYTDALAGPALFRKLPALALGLDSAFRLKPSFDPSLLSWLLCFLRNMSAGRHQTNTLTILQLALESQKVLHELLERHTIDFEYSRTGKMHLLYDNDAIGNAESTGRLKRQYGVAQEVLSPSEALKLEPALAQVSGLKGVIYSPGDEAGDSYRFSIGLLEICRREMNVRPLFDFQVNGIDRHPNYVSLKSRSGAVLAARRIVICAGTGASQVSGLIGLRLPIQPMRGSSFSAPLGDLAPTISLTDTRRKLVFCRLGDTMRVAGLAELGAKSMSIAPERQKLLVKLGQEVMPKAAQYDAIRSSWVGIRPMTPSSVPIVHRVDDQIGLNVGHGMLGWTLANGSAERIARLMLKTFP